MLGVVGRVKRTPRFDARGAGLLRFARNDGEGRRTGLPRFARNDGRRGGLDCHASLAMTGGGRLDCFTLFAMTGSGGLEKVKH